MDCNITLVFFFFSMVKTAWLVCFLINIPADDVVGGEIVEITYNNANTPLKRIHVQRMDKDVLGIKLSLITI